MGDGHFKSCFHFVELHRSNTGDELHSHFVWDKPKNWGQTRLPNLMCCQHLSHHITSWVFFGYPLPLLRSMSRQDKNDTAKRQSGAQKWEIFSAVEGWPTSTLRRGPGGTDSQHGLIFTIKSHEIPLNPSGFGWTLDLDGCLAMNIFIA